MNIRINATINGKNEQLLTLTQAGKYLGITRQAMLKKINNGKIRAVKTPEVYFVLFSEIRKIKKYE
jgi:excisionase family DNA binding protein